MKEGTKYWSNLIFWFLSKKSKHCILLKTQTLSFGGYLHLFGRSIKEKRTTGNCLGRRLSFFTKQFQYLLNTVVWCGPRKGATLRLIVADDQKADLTRPNLNWKRRRETNWSGTDTISSEKALQSNTVQVQVHCWSAVWEVGHLWCTTADCIMAVRRSLQVYSPASLHQSVR